MIYTSCLMLWATFAYARSPVVQTALGIFCASLAIFITGYYHYLQDPTFHQIAYAFLTAAVLLRSMYVMEVNIRPYYRKRRQIRQRSVRNMESERAEEQRQDERDLAILRTMWKMIAVGLSIFLGGFGLWLIDNLYCSRLRQWRREIGLPWGILLEGHGWWHLMTGVGAYFYIVWALWLRHCLNERQDEFEMIWPSVLTSVPRVERARGFTVLANGAAKKVD